MKKAGTILIYNCTDPKFTKMRQIFAMLRLLMRSVTPDKYDLSLLEVAEGRGEPAQEPCEPIQENVLVFCGLPQILLKQVLEVLRLAELPPIHYKAILTSTNKDWNTHQLMAELEKEKQAILEARKVVKEGQEEAAQAQAAQEAKEAAAEAPKTEENAQETKAE